MHNQLKMNGSTDLGYTVYKNDGYQIKSIYSLNKSDLYELFEILKQNDVFYHGEECDIKHGDYIITCDNKSGYVTTCDGMNDI